MHFYNQSDEAFAASEEANFTLIFIGAVSGEGYDRDTISFGDEYNALVYNFSMHSQNAIVIAVSPGIALFPWKDKVAAILVPFFPGEQYGNAIAELIFGKAYPQAKLPVTMPNFVLSYINLLILIKN